KEGVRVVQGTPDAPLRGPALCLRIRRIAVPGKAPRTTASLAAARPGPAGYVIQTLTAHRDVGPNAAVAEARAVAQRGRAGEVSPNAGLSELPGGAAASR